MNIECINHDVYRELKQLSWVIFSNLDVDIKSELLGDTVKTEVIFEGKTYTDISPYFEKNCAKRSLYKASFQIKEWDTPWGILTGINPARLVYDSLDKNELMEKYYTDEFRADLSVKVAKVSKNIEVDPLDISLYVGIPFCKTKCKYCSFISSSVEKANRYRSKYVDCLIEELKIVAHSIKHRKLKSIYIGGGTPTALDEADLERVLSTIHSNFDMKDLIEFTVEAGRVDTINREKLEIIKKYGADRISINPQVFDDEILAKMGRNHTSKDVLEAYEIARDVGFKAINMDIIYGLGGDFKYTVDTLMKLDPENVTIHTLAIKNGGELDLNYKSNFQDINYFYDKVQQNGYLPYYLYKQQYMIKPYENVGYHKNNTQCYYNVCMMQNLTDIVSTGSGTTTKINGESYFNNKFPLDYINNIQNILLKKQQILCEEN